MVSALPLRIVYFGTPAFAVPSLTRLTESRHPVVAVVSQPDRPSGRGRLVHATPTKTVAAAQGIPVLQPLRLKDPEFLARLSEFEPDLGVVAAYGRLLPDALLALPRLGLINVHGSLLPAYRGAAPVHRAVIAGEPETGVTIMRVISELDAGPTFAKRRRPIAPDETSAQVEQALSELGADLLIEVIEWIAEGRAVETPQDDSQATFAPKLTKEEGQVRWDLPAGAIHNRVRGLQPWPLASTRVAGTRVLIHRTARVPHAEAALGDGDPLAPGTVVSAGADGIVVVCGDAACLRILELQPEGKRVMDARDFLAGHPITRGTRLEPA
jgi:methionyl-tRNA formyltransferase